MKGKLSSYLLLAMLLAEAFLSRAITGSAMHQAMLLASLGLYFSLRWTGPAIVRVAGIMLGIAFAAGGAWMMNSGVAAVLLSDLPWPFHVAMGIHLWAWTWTMEKREPQHESGTAQAAGIAILAAGGAVLWSAGHAEIYGTSPWGVRALAVAVLLMAVVAIWKILSPGPVGAAAAAPLRRVASGRRYFWNWVLVAVPVLLAMVVVGTIAMNLSDRAAQWCFRWLSRDDDVTQLTEFGETGTATVSGGDAVDGASHQLPKRADIHLDDSVRFFLRFDDQGEFRSATRRPIYLRTSTMAHFSNEGAMGPVRVGEWRYDSDDGQSDGVTWLTGVAQPSRDLASYWLLISKKDSLSLPLMPDTRSVGVSGIYAFADDWYQFALDESQERVRFRAESLRESLRWQDLVGRSDLEKGEVAAEFRQLPAGDLTDRILNDALAAAPREWPLEARLTGIQAFIHERCEYSLRFENPRNLAPVENFLYGERLGHCELYAAATAMMLRAIGVPSRVAFGFAGGISSPGRRLVAFRESDYHAWAEVYLKDHGWVMMDTVPPGLGSAAPAEARPGNSAFSKVTVAEFEDLSGERLLSQVEVSWVSRVTTWVIDWVARWFVLLCAVIGVVALAQWWRRRYRSRRRMGGAGAETIFTSAGGGAGGRTGLLAHYLQAWSQAGWPKAPGQTLNEFLAGLKREGICGDELDEINAYLYRLNYAGAVPDPEREDEFRRTIAALVAVRQAGETG